MLASIPLCLLPPPFGSPDSGIAFRSPERVFYFLLIYLQYHTPYTLLCFQGFCCIRAFLSSCYGGGMNVNRHQIALLGHSENPPVEKLVSIVQQLGYTPHITRVPFGEPFADFKNVHGVIVLGGPAGVYRAEELGWLKKEIDWVRQAVEEGLPVFGICLGCQMLAHILGGDVFKGEQGFEFGFTPLTFEVADDPVFGDELTGVDVFQSHGDTYELRAEHLRLMRGERYPEQAVKFADNLYGVQFHPEISTNVIFRWYRHMKAIGLPLPPDTPDDKTLETLADQHLPQSHIWLAAFLERLFGRYQVES